MIQDQWSVEIYNLLRKAQSTFKPHTVPVPMSNCPQPIDVLKLDTQSRLTGSHLQSAAMNNDESIITLLLLSQLEQPPVWFRVSQSCLKQSLHLHWGHASHPHQLDPPPCSGFKTDCRFFHLEDIGKIFHKLLIRCTTNCCRSNGNSDALLKVIYVNEKVKYNNTLTSE